MQGTTEMWVRVPRPMRRAIEEVAAEHGSTMSEDITRAIELYFQAEFPDRLEIRRVRLP